MRVEVVFALPDHQVLRCIELPDGGTVGDAIEQSGIERAFPEVDLENMQAGVWGKPAERDCPLKGGDRVELYRPLEIDPREARRLKAGI